MKWSVLNDIEQLDEIRRDSRDNIVMIYKHSTRCSTSRLVLDRLERSWKEEEMAGVSTYFLDLIAYRELSNMVASLFNVHHESPQVLLIQDGRSIRDFSHFEIDYPSIYGQIKANLTDSEKM